MVNGSELYPKGFELGEFAFGAEVVWKDVYLKEDWEGFRYGLRIVGYRNEDFRRLRALLYAPPELQSG